MKNIFPILLSLCCLACSSYALDDSAASDIGCGGKPKPIMQENASPADVTCVCEDSVCNWVYTGN